MARGDGGDTWGWGGELTSADRDMREAEEGFARGGAWG